MTASPPSIPSILVGRDRELGVLRERLAAALAGQGGLVLIGGEAGIGKTSLAETLCREATEKGALVLVGRCFDLAETPAYGPWTYLFDRYRPDDHLPGPPSVFAERGMVGEVASQAVLFRQVLAFTEMIAAQRSIVLLLEDFQWSDPASLDLLRFLAHSLSTLPLLILATYRSDEMTHRHPLYLSLPSLVREANAARLDLRHLDDAAVRALVSQRYRLTEPDTARLVAYLQGRAEGNALFLGELLRSLEDVDTLRRVAGGWALAEIAPTAVPTLLRQVIDGRLARLDDESQALLAVAAVIGQEVLYPLWAAVAEVTEHRLLEVTVQADVAHLMRESADGTGAVFAHALVREAIYEGGRPAQRRRWHQRAGEVLAAMPEADPDAVANHFARAGDPRAAAWLLTAGERAQQAWAWLTAAERYEAALAFMERKGAGAGARGWLRYRLAVLRRFTDRQGSIASLAEAAVLAAEANDHVLAAQILFYQGLLHCLVLDVRRGIAEMEAGIAALDALPSAAGAWRTGMDVINAQAARSMLVEWLPCVGRFADARRIAEETLAEAADLSHGDGRDASFDSFYFGLAVAYAYQGQAIEARQAFDRARTAFRVADYPVMVCFACIQELLFAVLPYQTEQRAERDRLVAEAEYAAIQAQGAGMITAFPRLPLLALEGHWEAARRLAQSVYATDNPSARSFAGGILVPLAYAQGDAEVAWSVIRERLPGGPTTTPGSAYYIALPTLQHTAAMLALDADDLTVARAWLEAHDYWLAWSGAIRDQAEGHLGWAEYYRAVGDRAQAHQQARAAMRRATGTAPAPRPTRRPPPAR